MKMKLAEIAKAVAARNPIDQWREVEVTSVAFDSRHLTPGALFVPLQGEQDGHQYVTGAFENGAAATLWAADHPQDPVSDRPHLVVESPLVALQQLGKYYLNKLNPVVVAVTGSNGKTTTKDLIASVLATQMNVTKTPANFNNEIGVPVTLLNMESNTEAVVVEMGMDRFGQLDALSKLAHPDIAVITMIGEAHIEFFHSRSRIADAKMEIVNGLAEDGTLVYDGDEPLLRERAKPIAQVTRTFGRQLDNDLYATSVHAASDHVDFTVNQWPDTHFTIPLVGEYNVNNAMAALLVGQLMHVTVDNMRRALADAELTENRAEWVAAKHGAKILSDVYNSNPTAVREVLATLAQLPVAGRRIAVLGDMLELGDSAAALHAGLAANVMAAKLDALYLIGDQMASLRDRLVADGFPTARLHYYPAGQREALTRDLEESLQPGDVVLLKASHGLHLERVLDQLRAPGVES